MTEIDTVHETPSPEKLPKVMAALTLHAGPLPPPETVERYESVLPGAFDRILTLDLLHNPFHSFSAFSIA